MSKSWPAISGSLRTGLLDSTIGNADAETSESLTLRPPFEVIIVGETGHEVRDGDGDGLRLGGGSSQGVILAGLLEAAARG